ncbi:hypothetical protein ACXO4G_09000, partial [Lactobacillus delbrueckii subsp. bulgaricus]
CFGSESVSTTAHAIPQMEEHARSKFRTRETVRLLKGIVCGFGRTGDVSISSAEIAHAVNAKA